MTNPQTPHSPNTSDAYVTPEKSVFGTRTPRPTRMSMHLVLVAAVAFISLILTIYFVESDPTPKTSSTQTSVTTP